MTGPLDESASLESSLHVLAGPDAESPTPVTLPELVHALWVIADAITPGTRRNRYLVTLVSGLPDASQLQCPACPFTTQDVRYFAVHIEQTGHSWDTEPSWHSGCSGCWRTIWHGGRT